MGIKMIKEPLRPKLFPRKKLPNQISVAKNVDTNKISLGAYDQCDQWVLF